MAITVDWIDCKYKGLVMLRKLPQTICITSAPSLFLPQRREIDPESDGNVLAAVMLCLPVSLLLWAVIIHGVASLMH